MRLKSDTDGFYVKSCKKCHRTFRTFNHAREMCTPCFCKKHNIDLSEISVLLGGTRPRDF